MLHRFRPLLFAVLLAALPLVARADVRAVLVGVSDYLTLDADLKGPGNDVRLMAEVLIGRGVAAGEMAVLTSDAAGLPAGVATGPPTKAAIMAALADVAARAVAGDTVVFYFSGHGGQAPDQSGDEGGGYDEIFLPADAAGWKGAIGAVENALLDDELQRWAQALLSRGVKLVGLIDACHSDTGFRGLGAGAGVARGLSAQDLGIPDGGALEGGALGGGEAAPPLQGAFVFLYSSQSDQRSFEYPLGDTGLWQGEFTLRLAEVLRRSPDAAWAQVLAATSVAMVQGAAAQSPAGEGPLLAEAVFGAAAPLRFAVRDGVLQAGLLQGLNPGDGVALYAAPAGGEVLAHVTLGKVEARAAALPPEAAVAAWAEVETPVAPPALRLAPPLRADPGDGLDYAVWFAALAAAPGAGPGGGQLGADLVPVLVDGGLALAGPEGLLDHDGPGSTPRVVLQAGEDAQTALARVLEQAGHSLRLRRLFAAVAGRSLLGQAALELDWQRKPAPGCGAVGNAEPSDPAAGVQPCDQLWLRFTNVSGRDLDVSVLYFNADFSISPLWPQQGLSNRLAAGESGRTGLRIDPGSAAGLEEVLVLAVPVEPGAVRVDLTGLADPGGVAERGQAERGQAERGQAEQGQGRGGDWYASRLGDVSRGFSTKPAALMMIRQVVRVRTAQQGG